jgi:hypothetical protein
MINIKLEDKQFHLRNEYDELTIREFENITTILSDNEKQSYEKYIDIFCYLGLNELMDEISSEELIILIKNFNNHEIPNNLVKEIEVDGYKYVAYTSEEFSMKAKDMAIIEKIINKNKTNYVAEMLAVIFKREDLTKNEHYVDAHINHKASLFRDNLTVDIAIPYITYMSQHINKQLVIMKSNAVINI